MACVLEAAREAGVPVRAILLKAVRRDRVGALSGFDQEVILDDGKRSFGPEASALLTGTDGPVFSFVDGVHHVMFPLRQVRGPAPAPPFDFVLPAEPDLPVAKGAEIVPYDAVQESLRRCFQPRIDVLRRIADLTPERLVQVELPPPAPDRWLGEWLENLRSEPKVAHELPPRFVRYKLWRTASQIFREEADKLGGRFVDHPPEAVDGEGFMRDELVLNINHGNVAFGALLLARMRQLE
jgi:hypothetical protein